MSLAHHCYKHSIHSGVESGSKVTVLTNNGSIISNRAVTNNMMIAILEGIINADNLVNSQTHVTWIKSDPNIIQITQLLPTLLQT